MKPLLPVVLALSFLCGRGQEQRLSQQDSASIKTEVQQMLSAISDSLRTRGLDGWFPFLHQSPEFSWEFHDYKASYESLKADVLRERALWRSIDLVWDSVLVKPLTSDSATLSASYNETVVDSTGKRSVLTGSVEANLVRVSDAWRFQSARTFNESATVVK